MFGPMASTVLQIVTLDKSQPNYTLCHGLGLGLTGVLPQGHNKVIPRSQEGQLGLKQVKIACFCWFCFNSAHLSCQWWLTLT